MINGFRHSGGSRNPVMQVYVVRLDSGFRRNDKKIKLADELPGFIIESFFASICRLLLI